MQRPQQSWGSGQSGPAALGEMLISPVSHGDSVREAAAFSPTHWRKEILDSMNQEFPAWMGAHGSNCYPCVRDLLTLVMAGEHGWILDIQRILTAGKLRRFKDIDNSPWFTSSGTSLGIYSG